MSDNLLGQVTAYADHYAPEILFPIARSKSREALGIPAELPFHGVDRWNAYEISWLDMQGKPEVAVGEFECPITSPNIVESKSLKLYLNSLNGMRYRDAEAVQALIRKDLTAVCGEPVGVHLSAVNARHLPPPVELDGRCIDGVAVRIEHYTVDPTLLEGASEATDVVEETVHSHLLRSNCPVTGQPDWASVLISYRGPRIADAALMKYLVSFRNHNDYHEQCVERIFADLQAYCLPEALTVQAFYTRRGGLDINPFRSNWQDVPPARRLWRQ